jgi:hypothetical protein
VKAGLEAKKKIRKDGHLHAKKREEHGWTDVDINMHVW